MSVKVRKLRSGKWGLIINYQSKQKEIPIGTKAAAERIKLKVEIKLAEDKLGLLEESVATFDDVAYEWLDFIQMARSAGTYSRYKGIIEKHISEHLGNLPIDKITRGDVRNTLGKIYKSGSSKSSIELIHTVMSGVFTHALDDELITVLPTFKVLRKLDLKRDKKEIEPFTSAQIEAVLARIDYYEFFFTAYHTAARIGELCALQWSDVDFIEKKIRISKTAKDQLVKPSTKTHVNRQVDMSDELSVVLMEHKKTDKKLCFRLGIQQNHVFHKEGKLLPQNTLRRRLQRVCKKLGFGHKTIHDIRHTTASILLSRGVPLSYVSEMLGHSSQQITLTEYAHYMPSENKGMVNNLTNDSTTHQKKRV